MSNAPTPLPHTPVSYLSAGGSGFFSKLCQQLLINSKINPEWCGSYNHAASLIQASKKRCNAWAAMSPEERSSNPERMPTPEDRYLARCQSGHLIRDSNFRQRGGRGDPCANVVDGFYSSRAPCVPMWGHAREEGGVHCAVTTAEEIQAQVRREINGTSRYPQSQRHEDEDARGQLFASEHRRVHQREMEGVRSGSGLPDPVAAATQPLQGRAATGAKEPTRPKCRDAEQVQGETAAECLNNW